MFGQLTSTLGAKASALETKLTLYIIGGIIVLVIISLLLDGIRKYIRGLDTAALGGLLIWLGYQSSKIKLVSVLTNLLYLVGGTLAVTGLLAFILLKVFKRKRTAARSGPPMPKEVEPSEKEKAKTESSGEAK